MRQSDIPKHHLQDCFALVCRSIHSYSLLSAMDNDVTHQIDKLHKVEACFFIPVTAWVGNPLMLNIIVYGRVSGKDGAVNSLSPDLEELRYAVALGLVPLVMKDPCLPHY